MSMWTALAGHLYTTCNFWKIICFAKLHMCTCTHTNSDYGEYMGLRSKMQSKSPHNSTQNATETPHNTTISNANILALLEKDIHNSMKQFDLYFIRTSFPYFLFAYELSPLWKDLSPTFLIDFFFFFRIALDLQKNWEELPYAPHHSSPIVILY